MEKNYLSRVVWIVLAAMVALLCMFWLPSISVGNWSMRKVDMLADIRNDSLLSNIAGTDSLVAQVVSSDSVLQDKIENGDSNRPVLEGSYLTRDKHGNLITVEDSIINARAEATASHEGDGFRCVRLST